MDLIKFIEMLDEKLEQRANRDACRFLNIAPDSKNDPWPTAPAAIVEAKKLALYKMLVDRLTGL